MEWSKRTNYDEEDHQSEQKKETDPLCSLNDSKETTARDKFDLKNGKNMNYCRVIIDKNISGPTNHEKNNKKKPSPEDTSSLYEKRKKIRISFINIGGEHIYFAFHQIYFSQNAVYVLVLDMTKGFDEKEPSSLHNVFSQFESWTYKGR